jgi:CRISPR-associated exonuclease Cas4
VETVTFSDLATAAYCPRQLYNARRDDDRGPPPSVARVTAAAHRYPAILDGATPPTDDLSAARYRRRLRALRDRDPALWRALAAPAERAVTVAGRDCRGLVHKVLAGPTPVVVSPGRPPESGVWEPQSVRAVAAAKALAHREGCRVESAVVEYPRRAVVRELGVTGRRKAAYRRALRAVRSLDGPPPRIEDEAKCGACDYRTTCGVTTRSLRSLL